MVIKGEVMIDEVHITDLALIHNVSLTFDKGLTVITGETGSGKSALLKGLRLLLGERATKESIREGCTSACVEGRFFIDDTNENAASSANFDVDADVHDANANTNTNVNANARDTSTVTSVNATSANADACAGDIAPTFQELLVKRTCSADGKSRVSINGSLASLKELAATMARTVDFCGQFEHQRLMQAKFHEGMLDTFLHTHASPEYAAYHQAFLDYRYACQQLKLVAEAGEQQNARVEQARYLIRRVEELNPAENEYDELTVQLQKAQHSEELTRDVFSAQTALSGESGALDQLNTAISQIQHAAQFDAALAEKAQSLLESLYIAEDISRDISSYAASIEFDAQALDDMQQRMSLFQGLLHDFTPDMAQLMKNYHDAKQLLQSLDNSQEHRQKLEARVEQTRDQLERAACALAEFRKKGAPILSKRVNEVLAALEMQHAQFSCSVDMVPLEQFTEQSPCAVEFMYCPGEGMQYRQLVRIASGGEMSRVMLALKVVLGKSDAVQTLIFDEVDAGVGGTTAQALARVLFELSKTHQVILVTHLAQVAVYADTHYVVSKTDGTGVGPAETQVERLSEEHRALEIARMLSGKATDTSLLHARELIAAARAAD